MELLIKLFDVLFPVFLTIGIGYWYGKKAPKFNTKFITTFVGNIGLPCIIYYSLTSTNISFELFLRFSFYITLYVLLFSLIGIVILKILNKDIYRLLPPLILPNTGNMGMPLCLFAYGNMGLAIATASTAMILVFHFSIGILLASKKFSLEPLLKCIPVYALLVSLMAKGIKKGDAVFTTNFSFFATAEAISLVGATPVFVDIDESTFNINPNFLEEKIKNTISQSRLKPKCIIPVDLFGQLADYDAIEKIAQKYN